MSIGARLRAVALVAVVGLSLSGCGVNRIPTLEEAAKAHWAEVQNQYQRRSDLIPNLVATVQGYAKQEKDVLIAVTEARAKATSIHVDASHLTDPAKVKAAAGRAERAVAARSAGCWRSARTIPTSNRTRTSSRCNRSSRARKTASPSRAATTSARCRPIIPSCARSPA